MVLVLLVLLVTPLVITIDAVCCAASSELCCCSVVVVVVVVVVVLCDRPLLSCDGGRRGGLYTRRGCHRGRRISIARIVLMMKLLPRPLSCSFLCLMATPLQFSALVRVKLAGRCFLARPLPKAVL